jgi:hypothetical protein
MRRKFTPSAVAAVVLGLAAAGGSGCVGEPALQPCDGPVPEADSLFWHEGIASWILPRKDPYDLENFQRAYDNVARRNALPTRALAPTHYALKLYPRDEDQQWEIELTGDIEISYIPFTWIAVTEQQGAIIEQTAPAKTYFPEVSPWVAVHNEARTVEGELSEVLSYNMPIIYAAWPVDKPLPEDIEYEIDYEVLLPESAATRGGGLGGELLLEAEAEAISLALNRPVRAKTTATRADITLSGDFWDWEVLRPLRIPIPRIRVKFHLGSNIIEADADEKGYFSVSASRIPEGATWDIVYQNDKWKVTRDNSTIPKSFFQGEVYQSDSWSESVTHLSTSIQPQDATIIKSLDYYYYRTHNLTKWEYTGGIHVISSAASSSSYNGLFTYSATNNCYITVSRNNTTNTKHYLMGTILHELGHFIHYKEHGGTYKDFKDVDRLLQESFASYVGWYLTEKYYAEMGYVKPSAATDISGQARQTSWKSATAPEWGYYSPLFVDLVDNYDQSQSGDYNKDEVKEVHYSIIMKIASRSDDWESCRKILLEDVPAESKTITARDMEAFIAPYERWYKSY